MLPAPSGVPVPPFRIIPPLAFLHSLGSPDPPHALGHESELVGEAFGEIICTGRDRLPCPFLSIPVDPLNTPAGQRAHHLLQYGRLVSIVPHS